MHKYSFVEPIHDLDKEAATFLTSYGLEQYISTPAAVPIEELPQKMGLTIVDTFTLSSDGTIYGITAFADGHRTVYTDKKVPVDYAYKAGTILIDANLTGGSKRNTIAHECFHWYKHREFFLNRLHSKTLPAAAHQLNEKKKKTALDWAEWQSQKMAPRILMPKLAAERVINDYTTSESNIADHFPSFLHTFSSLFSVSKQSACLRLIELNVAEAKQYYAAHYSNPAKRLTGSIFLISKDEALDLYINNDAFFNLLHSGEYCYTTEGFVVRNIPQYIKKEHNVPYLTDYVWEHPEECFLPLDDYIHSLDAITRNGLCYRAVKLTNYQRVTGADSPVPQSTTELNNRALYLKKELSRIKEPCISAAVEIWKHIESIGWSQAEFLNATNLSASTYARLKDRAQTDIKNRNNPSYEVQADVLSLQSLLPIFFALHLEFAEVYRILDLTTFSIKHNIPQHRAFLFCLDYCKDCNINDANQILIAAGYEPFQTNKA